MAEERPDVEKSVDKDDIAVEYANNAAFDATVWDLKLIFGEYSERAKGIEWHTSVTIPWALAKLMIYYLQVNVAAHEASIGKVNFPLSMLPPPAPEPSDADDKRAHAVFEIIQTHRAKFIESLK